MLPATPQTPLGGGAAPTRSSAHLNDRTNRAHPCSQWRSQHSAAASCMLVPVASPSISQSLTLVARSRSDPYMTMTTRRCVRLHPISP